MWIQEKDLFSVEAEVLDCGLEQTPVQTPVTILYLPTPPLGQDMTQGQFLSGV